MVAVVAIVLCVVWVALFVTHPSESTLPPSDKSGGYIQIVKWSMTRVWQLVAGIGVTMLAAIAVGLWTRRKA